MGRDFPFRLGHERDGRGKGRSPVPSNYPYGVRTRAGEKILNTAYEQRGYGRCLGGHEVRAASAGAPGPPSLVIGVTTASGAWTRCSLYAPSSLHLVGPPGQKADMRSSLFLVLLNPATGESTWTAVESLGKLAGGVQWAIQHGWFFALRCTGNATSLRLLTELDD